jgi:hypothetical protein
MRSLRRQLTASLIGAFGLILGGGGFASYWGIRDLLYDQFNRGLADRARAIISAAVPRDDSFSAYFSDRFLRSFDDDVGTEYFQVYDPSGRSIQRSDSLHNENLLMRYGKPDAPAIWDLELPSGKPGRALGEVHDLEVRVTVYMPWHLWSFLNELPRVEILYHSIHYVDLVRSFLGEPEGVYAKTVKHPETRHLASTRTNIALDYGDLLRANITTNHGHRFGPTHEESYIKWEGTRGALKARLGLLMDYPRGRPDALQQCLLDEEGNPGEWENVPFEGSWYPHAFLGPMSSLQRFLGGETDVLPTAIADAIRTMAVVEGAYRSSEEGATPIPPV